MTRGNLSDGDLVQAVLGGQTDRFGELVDRHFQMVYAIAYGGTANHADAEDLTQETFVRAYRGLRGIQDAEKVKAWLATIARNVLRTAWRSRQREAKLEAEISVTAPRVAIPSSGELAGAVREQIHTLDPVHRECLLLHYFAGLSTAEIAENLGISNDAAKKRLERARKALGEALVEALPDSFSLRKPAREQRASILAAVAGLPISALPVRSMLQAVPLKLAVGAACVIGAAAVWLATPVWFGQASQQPAAVSDAPSATAVANADPARVPPTVPDAAPASAPEPAPSLAAPGHYAAAADASPGLEARVAELERRVAALERAAGAAQPQSQTAAQTQEARNQLREKFNARMEADRKRYTDEQLREIESLYQVANKQWNTPEARQSLQELCSKYTDANRTGCAVLYLGQMLEGADGVAFLESAIKDYGDCMYGDGAQVGALARFYLGQRLKQQGREADAARLFDELRTQYPNAVAHNGRPLVDALPK